VLSISAFTSIFMYNIQVLTTVYHHFNQLVWSNSTISTSSTSSTSSTTSTSSTAYINIIIIVPEIQYVFIWNILYISWLLYPETTNIAHIAHIHIENYDHGIMYFHIENENAYKIHVWNLLIQLSNNWLFGMW